MRTGGAPADERASAADLAVLAARLRLAARVCEDGAAADSASSRVRQDVAVLAEHPALLRLIGAADTDGSRLACDAGSPSPRWTVRLMGGFSVTIDGRDATPARGNGAAIVKLLALRGPLTADALIDTLWPTADAAVGNARLRNTLSRLRRTTGDVAIRRDGLLMLHPGVRVDAVEFERGAFAALQARRAHGAAGGPEAVLAALGTFGGELLPADRYVDWFDEDRALLWRRYLELADLAIGDAEDRGDLDAAVQLLESAVAVDPFDEGRLVRLARHLVALGHRAAGRWAVERALAVTRELGLAPCAELRHIAGAVTVASERVHPSFRSMTA
ncbi:AfsR/SARP family transcriptional regulator [Desertimonas flava]|uniref:AfsR/SARP family transcriptional regulator n=1 Tax=Desertimonas flava TaxID=2064846 RepID=UPI0013C4FAA7|nr:BTAD domain-containing putative transcriptional regulator [Desertimonas flava]